MASGKTKKKPFGTKEVKPQKAPEERKVDENKPLPSGVLRKDIRGIVRLSGRDIKGELDLRRAMAKVKGIGERLSEILHPVAVKEFHLHEKAVVGELSEDQLEQLEKMLANPGKYSVPSFFLNRQNDWQSGETSHLIGNELTFSTRQDIEHEKKAYTWKGYRHSYGQKVRGQRTRTSGRTGMTVGVLRKALLKGVAPGAAGAPADAGAAAQAAKTKDKTEAAGPAPKAGAGEKAAAPKAGAAPVAGKPAEKPAGKPAEKK